jgi:hypothetical protein
MAEGLVAGADTLGELLRDAQHARDLTVAPQGTGSRLVGVNEARPYGGARRLRVELNA